MRIIAGQWRGRQIVAPDTLETRPILDRVKTVLFDMLGTRLAQPGRLPELAVLDLFAGSGSLGLEALSRGARYCLFVEQSRLAASVLRQNLDAFGVIDEGEVQQNEVLSCRILPPPRDPQAPDRPGAYELVFVDPPYRLLSSVKPDRAVRQLLTWLAEDPMIAPGAFIVVRHPAPQHGAMVDLSPLVEDESREVGKMILRFMKRPQAEMTAPPEAEPQP